MPRRSIGAALAILWVTLAPGGGAQAPATVSSPDRALALTILPADGRLTWSVRAGQAAVIEPSALGILVDGVDLGQGATLGRIESYRVDDSYPWRGIKSEIKYRANGVRIRRSKRLPLA